MPEELPGLSKEGSHALERVLGYLNFSSGAEDPKFLFHLNLVCRSIVETRPADPSPSRSKPLLWRATFQSARQHLEFLRSTNKTFDKPDQAEAVLTLAHEHVVPAYRRYHRDLLYHQSDETVFGPFMVGRIFEAIQQQGAPWGEVDRIVTGTIGQLNDYIGHRPVATLESQRIEPYPHEWIRPIPIYVDGAGVQDGAYRDLVEMALAKLRNAEAAILRAAFFDPDNLQELAFDPRAYDFDHPANKRPNYHFGQWDPHCIDNRGYYRRFVIQQVTLDALLARVEHHEDVPINELLDEAASVLAGTMLMASGISGNGPECHDSETTLGALLPGIAAYRDAFYERLLEESQGQHGNRLRRESLELHQPYGGARQHLNTQMSRLRAAQLGHVHLAKIFARMDYPAAAKEQLRLVPVASARMRCEIDCHITTAHRLLDRDDYVQSLVEIDQAVDVLKRAIACGATIDPWNFLGFDANFSLFPALENSVHDHRADELIDLVEHVLTLFSQTWSVASAADDTQTRQEISAKFEAFATWWNQFAVHEVSSVDGSSAVDAFVAAQNVSKALNIWHKSGAEAGDIRFWAPHAEVFNSPKAYAFVVETLLQRRDFVASRALLVHWLSRSDQVDLDEGDVSFHRMAQQWLQELLFQEPGEVTNSNLLEATTRCQLVLKFFDYLEANADSYWDVPRFELGNGTKSREEDPGNWAETQLGDDEANGEDGLFSAAYEDVVYRDSTDDGVDGQIFDSSESTEDELEVTGQAISDRLEFLQGMARLWRNAAMGLNLLVRGNSCTGREPLEEESRELIVTSLRQWSSIAASKQVGLMRLLNQIYQFVLPNSSGEQNSLIRYDRQRLIKESLLDQVILTCVSTKEAEWMVCAELRSLTSEAVDSVDTVGVSEFRIIEFLSFALSGDVNGVQEIWPDIIELLAECPILYVPVNRGGAPKKVVAARVCQMAVQILLRALPRLGMISETCQLIETTREMERAFPVGPGAVTEYDELFEVGYRTLAESLVRAAESTDRSNESDDPSSVDQELVTCLEQATERLLVSWLTHSRTLRLSILEKVVDDNEWEHLIAFIKRYGDELFTQQFFNLANIRAILHQGTDTWLDQLVQLQEQGLDLRILDDLQESLSFEDATKCLNLVLEAIVENYGEYRDYNSTTTQSDRGELLYTLLDFLRLRSAYDRVVWNLKPVILSHEILVRRGRNEAAQLWRRALSERVTEEADRYQQRLNELQIKYAMRMPTVSDRINERFVRPLIIDRMRALVRPAIEHASQQHDDKHAFDILADEAVLLMKEPGGVGLEIPNWLISLEDEVDHVLLAKEVSTETLEQMIPMVDMGLEEIQEQMDRWHQRRGNGLSEDATDDIETDEMKDIGNEP